MSPRGTVVTLQPWKGPARGDVAKNPACKAAARAQAKLSAKAKALTKPDDAAQVVEQSPQLLICAPTRKGAWALLFEIVDYPRNRLSSVMHHGCEEEHSCVYDTEAKITVAHFTPTGARVDGPTFTATSWASQGWGDETLAVYDFDGDGEEEAVVLAEEGRILTLQDKTIKPYAPAQGIAFSRLVDVDGDGRPDLGLTNPYQYGGDDVIGQCGTRRGHPIFQVGPEVPLVVHALADGRFSRDDAIARGPLAALCPERPKKLVPKKRDGSIDNGWLRENVVCARVRGASAAEVTATLKKECTYVGGEECDALFEERDGQPVKVCTPEEQLARWATLPPPLTLP